MVLDDIVFPESEDDFVLEISNTSTGELNDIVCKGDTTSGHVVELTLPAGTYPAESDVENGVDYGPTGGEFEGNVTLPTVNDVKKPVQYGANGTEFTGTYEAGGAPPNPRPKFGGGLG